MARELFMPDHPWFKGIVEHRWSREQIVLGEIQHYLRVRTNPIFFGYIVTNVASERNYALMEIVMENFMEELGGEKTHVDIMLQLLDEAGISREAADTADPAPGTLAAIEMIRSGCQNRSALEGISLLSFVEAMHGGPDGAAARVPVVGVVGVFAVEGLELADQLCLSNLEHVGDHTRGLFEAEAAVASSAAHPLHDEAIVVIHAQETSRAMARCVRGRRRAA